MSMPYRTLGEIVPDMLEAQRIHAQYWVDHGAGLFGPANHDAVVARQGLEEVRKRVQTIVRACPIDRRDYAFGPNRTHWLCQQYWNDPVLQAYRSDAKLWATQHGVVLVEGMFSYWNQYMRQAIRTPSHDNQ